MGVNSSVPSDKKDDGEFIGAFGNVADNINPIFDDHTSDKKKGSANAEQLDLDSVLDELRRKRDAHDHQNDQDSHDGDQDSSSDTSSDDGELKVGKLHRDRLKRDLIEDHQDLRLQLDGIDISIEGDPYPLQQLRLRCDEAVNFGSIKWFLSDDVGGVDIFKVLPFEEGTICKIPVNSIGRNIKAVCSVLVNQYQGKGYQATVGEAIDPITGETLQRNLQIAGNIATTIGPVSLPDDWYLKFDELLTNSRASDSIHVSLSFRKRELGGEVKLTVRSNHISLKGVPQDFSTFDDGGGGGDKKLVEMKGRSLKIQLAESVLVKFISSPTPTISIKVDKKSSDRFIVNAPNEPLSKLLFIWAFIIVCQATAADPESTLDKKALFQKWLESRRHYDLIT